MARRQDNTIAIDACRNGWVYRLRSRNLAFGVFVKESNGFIGLREKFGHKYLFAEYHWDTGAPFGTVCPLEELEPAPPGLVLKEIGPLIDSTTNRPVTDTRTAFPAPPAYIYADTGEPCTSNDIRYSANQPLHDFMTQIEAKYRGPDNDDKK